MVRYKAIEIYSSEDAKVSSRPITDAVIDYIRGLKIAARCMVTRSFAGCYENGEIATNRIEIFSHNMPLKITIVLPEGEVKTVLNGLNPMVGDGMVVLQDLNVVSHKLKKSFFPRHLKVRDVMTSNPKSILKDNPLSDTARILLSSIFTGMPVVDTKGRPLGVITQGDLIQKGGLPVRLGLLSESDSNRLETVLKKLAEKSTGSVMNAPAITIGEDQWLFKAVNLMLEGNLKRLPVVDETGRFKGMISRDSLLRTGFGKNG